MFIEPFILCRGSGTRLWPLSGENNPKPLLKLAGDLPMLQSTTLRLQGLQLEEGDHLGKPLLVANKNQLQQVNEIVDQLKQQQRSEGHRHRHRHRQGHQRRRNSAALIKLIHLNPARHHPSPGKPRQTTP